MSDYVVVGAGSTGCVIARRLAESGARVTLIEAGGSDRSLRFVAPAMYPLIQDSDADWCFRTAPQRELDDRIIPWPRGKVLGGSSSINAMIWIRGHRSNYDAWADAGCDGWSWADVEPLFERVESRVGVEPLETPLPACTAFVEACAHALDLPAGHDFNGSTQKGSGLFMRSCRDARRDSASTAYLRDPVEGLSVLSNALARRVVVENGRAVGVEVSRGSTLETIRADREVIVCAGAIGSPHVLMLSGIGPADHLREHGVEVVADVPGVGDNLQDHVFTPASWRCTDPRAVMQLGPFTVISRVLQWTFGRRSALATNHAEAGAFFHTRPGAAPDMQFHFGPWGASPAHPDGRRADPPKGPHFSISATLLYPRSRGSIRLASARAEDAPTIDAGYFTEPDDLDVMVRGLEAAREVVRASPLRELAGEPANAGAGATTRDETIAGIRATSMTMFHPVGTCRMGVDAGSVVTPQLSVRGVEGLRVADASIMPTIIGGNTNAACMMIGERLASFIAS